MDLETAIAIILTILGLVVAFVAVVTRALDGGMKFLVVVVGVIMVAVGVGIGFGGITTAPTQQIAPTPQYDITYALPSSGLHVGYASSATASNVTLKTDTFGSGQSAGIQALATMQGGDFLQGVNHNATLGTVMFAVSFSRIDIVSTSNISLILQANSIPTVTNTTSGVGHLLINNTVTGTPEVTFTNQSQGSQTNVIVFELKPGATNTVYVTAEIQASAVNAMTLYTSVTFNLELTFGSGQHLQIPVEITRI